MLKILNMDQIVNGKNIRNEKDSEITELAASILAQGLINPILVQKRQKDGKYVVIAGHRRYEAVKYLGLPHIECNILDDDLNTEKFYLFHIYKRSTSVCYKERKRGVRAAPGVSARETEKHEVW